MLDAAGMQRPAKRTVLIADPSVHTRRIVADVLRGVGIQDVVGCNNGVDLLTRTEEHNPSVVITTSRLPGVSGLEYARLVRSGFRTVPRNLAIIAMTDSPTRSFVEAARDSGVDEMLVRPVSAKAVLTRMNAVVASPRAFIDSACYAGPCRRRRSRDEYEGALRRLSDPIDGDSHAAPWESAAARSAMMLCVRKVREAADGLAAGDRRKLRAMASAAKEVDTAAQAVKDRLMSAAARSLSQYISGVGASPLLDLDIIHTHIDALYSLCVLRSQDFPERRKLVDGLEMVVRKRLDRQRNQARSRTASLL